MSSVFEYFCYVTTAGVDASLSSLTRFYSYLAQPEGVTADIYREILARASTRMFEHFRLLKHVVSWEDIFAVIPSSRVMCRRE
jgi:hypothetical protein